MFYKEVVILIVFILRPILATSCKPKCGIPSEWMPVANNVCYGTKDNDFGRFEMNRHCELYAIRLVHVSGFQNHWSKFVDRRSRWGWKASSPEMCTLLLKDGKLFIPKKVMNHWTGYYLLDGFSINDDVIIIKQNETLTTGEELEIAFCRDFKDYAESEHEGTHCVDVDVSCYD